MQYDTDIIISGAGPTGLALACVLAQAGIACRVFERLEALPRDLRAGSFHPPSLEMLETIGVADAFVAMGIKVPHWQIRDRREGLVVEWDLGLLAGDTAYPYRLHCEQFKLTPLLLDRFRALGGTVDFSTEVTGMTQDEDGVSVRTVGAQGRVTYRARHVVAADGTRSPIRESAGIAYEGFTWPERFLVMGTFADLGVHGFTPNAYVADPDEWAAIFKMPYVGGQGGAGGDGLWRVLVPVGAGPSNRTLMSDAFVEERLQALCPQPFAYSIEHRGIYLVHQKVADRFREGRALLMGDAAHANNPLGAFGLNGGLHDAFNLGEKLMGAYADPSQADSLFDLYAAQRHHACTGFVQAQSISNKKMLEEREEAARQANFARLRNVAADPAAARDYLLRSSMIASVRAAAQIGLDG